MNQNIMIQSLRIRGFNVYRDQKINDTAYGEVFRGKFENKEVAVKMIKKSQLNHQQKLAVEDEIFFQENLNHENILKQLGQYEDDNYYYVAFELCDRNCIEFMQDPNPEINPIFVIYQALRALLYLLSQKCIHRELSPKHILFLGKTVKLSAVGHFRVYLDDLLKDVTYGIHYLSPQLLRNLPYSSKTDIFSVGVIAYQLLQKGNLPWGVYSKYASKQQYLEQIKQPLVFTGRLSQQEKDFLRSSLEFYEKDRMSILKAINHPIFSQYHSEFPKEITPSKIAFSQKYFTLDNPERFCEYIKVIDTLSKTSGLKKIIQNALQRAKNREMNEHQFYGFLMFICSQIEIDKGLAKLIFEKLDVDESGGISAEEVQRALIDREKEIEDIIESQYKRYCIRLYHFLKNKKQNIHKKSLLQYFYDFCHHDFSSGRVTMKLEGFKQMLRSYEEVLDREIYPMEDSTKERVFENIAKRKPNKCENEITFLCFQNHFVEITGIHSQYGLDTERGTFSLGSLEQNQNDASYVNYRFTE